MDSGRAEAGSGRIWGAEEGLVHSGKPRGCMQQGLQECVQWRRQSRANLGQEQPEGWGEQRMGEGPGRCRLRFALGVLVPQAATPMLTQAPSLWRVQPSEQTLESPSFRATEGETDADGYQVSK